MTTDRTVVGSAILAAGLLLAGLLVGVGFAKGRDADRYVTVKGVSEREARADLAIWPLGVVAADDDLGRAHASVQRSVREIKAFLVRNQIDTTDVTLQQFVVNDALTNQYAGAQVTTRFVIRQTVVVRSTQPERVAAASQRVGELVSAGVVLSSGGEYGPGGPTYVFTKLNDLKPPMIAEATARARESAEQFARDARSELGGIRRANQGIFEILPRDQAPGIFEGNQILKTVRVVSTVEYLLQ
ncbi:MAG TPA: SIMPL domain-containing protein [Gemmatimonadaceae bacterium]|nr:SIMPL domain-containing protein [Gemmatimonadaceae bacterium]